MAYHIYLDLFEGPLDLLLFLVSRAQIDIKDIFVSKVTGQYLEFVNSLHDEDMDRASEFIHMAARLIEIKSRKLLPKPRIEDAEEEDPEQALIRQLEDFKLMKEASEKLSPGHEIAQARFYREPSEQEEKVELDLSDVSLKILQETFQKLLLISNVEQKAEEIREIIREEITVESKISYISKALYSKKKLSFNELFPEFPSKYEVITTFMALLEMLRLNQILVKQSGYDKDLIISLKEKSA
ncbi:MAG: segregation/condensation protein A [Clostridia bacterium]|nr:segregation/condensation protein A [Clostridia bacterium]